MVWLAASVSTPRLSPARSSNVCSAARARSSTAVASGAVEELNCELRLQGLDRRAHGRLRQAERVRGARHVKPLGDEYEDAQLFEGHSPSINRIDQFDDSNELDC
jgi:hypothetical protein